MAWRRQGINSQLSFVPLLLPFRANTDMPGGTLISLSYYHYSMSPRGHFLAHMMRMYITPTKPWYNNVSCYLWVTHVLGYKTCLDTKPVLYQDRFCIFYRSWICPKTGQYKTCIVSNTKIEASIRATKPKPWQSHLTSETVEIFIQNEKAGLVPMQSRFWCGRLSVGTKPVLVQQV